MRDKYGAIVVGSGYFGCACACFLAKAGVPTLLVEAGELIRGASGANFGNVQVQDAELGVSLALTLAGFERMKRMERELECDIGYAPCGSLIVAEREAHLPELRRLYEGKRAAGLDVQWLEGEAVYEAEPNLAPGSVLAATYFEQGRIYPFPYLYALLRQGRGHGLEVREHTPAKALYMEGGRCAGIVLEDGSAVRAGHVIVAAGSGTAGLCATAGLDVPVRSVKAECFVTEAIAPFLRTYYSSAAFFADAHGQRQASTSLCISQSHYGNLLIAETTKPHDAVARWGQDCTSLEHCRNIHAQLMRAFPVLEQVQILRSWAVPSPFTDNCLPVFGKSPVPGLILAAGFKSAVVMSGVVGEIVRDLVVRDSCDWDLSPFMADVKPLAAAAPQ